MSRNIYQTLTGDSGSASIITLAAGGSGIVDMDLVDVQNMQVMVSVTYPQTSSTTGVSLNLKGGFGMEDTSITQTPLPYTYDADGSSGSSVPIFSDNVEAVTMATMPGDWGIPITVRTNFYLSDLNVKWPRWLRMEFLNNDASQEATVQIHLDL